MDKLKRLIGGGPRDGGTPGFELVLEGRRLHFRAPDELGVALRPRTEVTAAFARHNARLGAEILQVELEQTRRLHGRLTEVLQWCFETGEPVGTAWREFEEASFVDEHQWRAILKALGGAEVPDPYRRVALVRFMRYLESRCAALEEAVGGARKHPRSRPVRGLDEERSDKARRQDKEDISFTSVKRSMLYRRLPPNRAVELALESGETVPVYLAHLRIRLVAVDGGWVIKDEHGLEVELLEGRLIVGRADDCDVVLRHAPVDVSRYHLAIERHDDELRLIDLSSQGTYLPRRALLDTPSVH
jgi:hypothetical protein